MSLGFVSPGAATDRVIPIYKKNWQSFFSHCYKVTTFLAVVSSQIYTSHLPTSCRGVIHRLRWRLFRTINLTRIRIAFLREGNGISKIDTRFFISSLIGLKFCIPLEVDNTQNRAEANFEFRPLKNLAPLWILRLHYGQWDEKFQIGFTRVSEVVLGWYFQAY